MPRDKPRIGQARGINNDTFYARHICHHRITRSHREIQNLWQKLGSSLRRRTDDDDIGLGDDGWQVQAETIDQPQSQTALKGRGAGSPGNQIGAPVAALKRTRQRPRNQSEAQKSNDGVVISVHDQMGARG